MTVEASAAEAPAPASGEALAAALSNPASNETTAAPKPEVPRAEQFEKAVDADLMKVWAKNNPPRDPITKQFLPRDKAAAATDDKPAEAQAATDGGQKPPDTNTADQPKEGEPEPAKPVIEPPHSWSAAEKAKWATVPPDLQTYIAKRETEAMQAISRMGEQRTALEQQVRAFEPIEQLIQANQDQFAKYGVAPHQGFAALLQAQRMLDENPVACLVQLGLQKGIDLRPVFSGQQQHAQVNDPRVAQLQSEIVQLKQNLAAHASKVTEREQAERATQEADVARVISDFAKDKPYFEEVRGLMSRFLMPTTDAKGNVIAEPEAQTLQDAYDMAVHAKPSIRTRIQSDQRKAEEDKRKAEEKATADAARNAAAVNVRSDHASRSTPKTVDDTLRDVARRMYG